MTTWSVVKEDTRESRRTASYFRYALAAFAALLVLSLGMTLIPRPAPEPPAPPFSEQARASALAETLRLRAASQQLAADSSGAQRLIYSRTVTLLTTQARALLLPSDAPSSDDAGVALTAPPDAGPSPSASGSAAPAAAAPLATAASLAAGLSASGRLRLTHAQTADGGMARLLAAVGTAQLVQAVALAEASGTAVPALPPAPAGPPALAAACRPSPNAAPSSAPAGQAATASPVPAEGAAPPPGDASDASATAALGRVVRTEVETVYGYQVALTRLDGQAAGQLARDLLARHEALVDEAETHSRVYCAPVPPREPGYALDASFLKNPATGLASLEAGTLPVYGDLVALSDGPTRQWAIASLLGAAQRAVRWGSDPGPVPGLVLDTSQLPPLPETATPTASPSSPPA